MKPSSGDASGGRPSGSTARRCASSIRSSTASTSVILLSIYVLMPIAKVHPVQVIEHRLSAAILNLSVQRSEVFPITQLRVANSKRRITPFKSACRNDPSRLRQHHHMQEIPHLNEINAL